MTFLPQATRQGIPGMGNKEATMMIIGDCPDTYAIKDSRPIAGPPESTLEECLHQAGLIKSDVFITNVLDDIHEKQLKKFWNTRTKKVVGNIDGYKSAMFDVIKMVDPKVIIAMGELPAYILTGNGSVAKTRGYPFLHDSRIVIPVEHPRNMIWSNYIARYYLSHDLNKAGKLSENPKLLYQPEIETRIPQSYAEACAMLEYALTRDFLSIDIEVSNFEVSCFGFAASPKNAWSIPFDMRWTLEEEVRLWNLVAQIMENPAIAKIGQNFIFDIHFMLIRVGIFTRGKIIDTMMGHSILYPDFLKSLNFLASIHTMQPYWKDMVKFKDPKKES